MLTRLQYARANAILQMRFLWCDVERNRMKKSTSGIVLVAGPLLALFGGAVSSYANRQDSTPDMDWQWNLINGVGVLMMLAGLMAFFFGAMWFSRKS